ncbi:vacuolar iron transporter 4-like protein [Sesbania bispinosa]|nr:vacuolar iron transporter 4-like protein [Sesbania bispinosa]
MNGLVSYSILNEGVGAVKQDNQGNDLIRSCAIEKRQGNKEREREGKMDKEKESLPNPLQAAAASALAFSVGCNGFLPCLQPLL